MKDRKIPEEPGKQEFLKKFSAACSQKNSRPEEMQHEIVALIANSDYFHHLAGLVSRSLRFGEESQIELMANTTIKLLKNRNLLDIGLARIAGYLFKAILYNAFSLRRSMRRMRSRMAHGVEIRDIPDNRIRGDRELVYWDSKSRPVRITVNELLDVIHRVESESDVYGAFLKYRLSGMNLTEIAEAMEVSRETIKNISRRARSRLRSILDRENRPGD